MTRHSLRLDPSQVVQRASDKPPTAHDPDDPTTAEFGKGLKTALSRMLDFVDDQGEPMILSLNSGLVVVVPPTMMWTALESINSTLVSSTSNVLQGAAKVITFPYLSATDTFYLLYTGASVRPFVFQDRMPVDFIAMEQDSEDGFKCEVFQYDVRARYKMTYGYWQYAVQVKFAA